MVILHIEMLKNGIYHNQCITSLLMYGVTFLLDLPLLQLGLLFFILIPFPLIVVLLVFILDIIAVFCRCHLNSVGTLS